MEFLLWLNATVFDPINLWIDQNTAAFLRGVLIVLLGWAFLFYVAWRRMLFDTEMRALRNEWKGLKQHNRKLVGLIDRYESRFGSLDRGNAANNPERPQTEPGKSADAPQPPRERNREPEANVTAQAEYPALVALLEELDNHEAPRLEAA